MSPTTPISGVFAPDLQRFRHTRTHLTHQGSLASSKLACLRFQHIQLKSKINAFLSWLRARARRAFDCVFIQAKGCSTAARIRPSFLLLFFWEELRVWLRCSFYNSPLLHPLLRAMTYQIT